MSGMRKAAQHYGLTKYEFRRNLSIDEIKYYLSQDIPVIVNIRNFFSRRSHAVVIEGYDDEGVVITDPAKSMSVYQKDYQTFASHW